MIFVNADHVYADRRPREKQMNVLIRESQIDKALYKSINMVSPRCKAEIMDELVGNRILKQIKFSKRQRRIMSRQEFKDTIIKNVSNGKTDLFEE